jgi:transcriptional regulator with XRE-family HTH domain
MKTRTNQALWDLRRMLGLNQGEFAAMIGASKDAVASWDSGRNRLSMSYARRIAFATGVDEESLLKEKGPPTVTVPLAGRRPYTAEDFAHHRGTVRGRSDAAGARHHLEHCADTLRLILMAAAGSGREASRQRLPGVLHAFIEWSQGVRRDFKLGEAIDAQLEKRTAKSKMKLSYGEWRSLARGQEAWLKELGFRDDPRKRDEELLELEVAMRPGWSPGRRMRVPNAFVTEVLPPRRKRGTRKA